MILRVSAKLGQQIKVRPEAPLPPHPDPFRDWSAHLFRADRRTYVLLANTPSLYAVVFPARGVTGAAVLIQRIADALEAVRQAEGDALPGDPLAAPLRDGVAFSKALSRSVTGSMNDQVRLARTLIELRGASTGEVEQLLRRTPMSALHQGFPDRAFRAQAALPSGETMKTRPDEIPVYQLHVSLEDAEPAIWRRVLVGADIPLDWMHRLLQVVMGWTNSHLHRFEAGGVVYGEDADGPGRHGPRESRTRLHEVLRAEGDRLTYEYDFGDGWRHQVLLEKIVELPSDVELPHVLAGERACPPEDSGGVFGYAWLLETVRDPSHPDHAANLEWLGEDFDPEAFDADAINARMHGRR